MFNNHNIPFSTAVQIDWTTIKHYFQGKQTGESKPLRNAFVHLTGLALMAGSSACALHNLSYLNSNMIESTIKIGVNAALFVLGLDLFKNYEKPHFPKPLIKNVSHSIHVISEDFHILSNQAAEGKLSSFTRLLCSAAAVTLGLWSVKNLSAYLINPSSPVFYPLICKVALAILSSEGVRIHSNAKENKETKNYLDNTAALGPIYNLALSLIAKEK